MPRYGLLIVINKEIGVPGIHLLCQGQNLKFIPGVLREGLSSDCLS